MEISTIRGVDIQMHKKQKTVFVTGAEGFLGRYTTRAFHKAGWCVVGLGHATLPAGEHTKWGMEHMFHGDISPMLLTSAFDGYGAPDLLIHAAGASSVRQAASNPYAELALTVGSTAAVADFIRQYASGCTLIYISSAAVYGCEWREAIPISAATNPISVYGLHKHMSEQLILGAGAIYGLQHKIVRYFSLYGPGQSKQLLWDVLRRVNNGEQPLELGGNGEETRDFLYVKDAANLLIALAHAGNDVPTIVNGGTGTATTISEMVKLLLLEQGGGTDFYFTGQVRHGDPRDLVADISCLQSLPLYSPAWSLQAGVRAYVDWVKQRIYNDTIVGAYDVKLGSLRLNTEQGGTI
ncbi:MAG TPA: NAD(P)-dependent oxidoreductase [Acidiferrobacteraceae bacterium]|nr:NAD(P)-dependent oxidoreductase [Acidiferrobacteraceae bacterium]